MARKNEDDAYSPTEKEVLLFIYRHPGPKLPTEHIASQLRPEQMNGTEKEREAAHDEIIFAFESLLLAEAVKGNRMTSLGKISYTSASLTAKGERAAIKLNRVEAGAKKK